ncbi:MAG: hypothetical protein ACP5L4_01830 [Thermoplasmata archaeon]
MKKEIKIGLVFLVLGILILTGLLFQTNIKNVSVSSNNVQQKMPFSVKYGFTAGVSGSPYFFNNLIFVMGSTNTYVYNSQFIQVAKLSIGNPLFLIAPTNSEVFFIYKTYYYIFNTTTYILSVNHTSPFTTSTFSIGSYFVQPVIQKQQDYVVNIYQFSYNFVSGGKNWTAYVTQWVNETPTSVYFEYYNSITNLYGNISFPTNTPMDLLQLFHVQNNVWSGNASDYYEVSGLTHSFVPTFTPVIGTPIDGITNVFVINNYTFAVLGQMVTGISQSQYTVTTTNGNYYLDIFNLKNGTSKSIFEPITSKMQIPTASSSLSLIINQSAFGYSAKYGETYSILSNNSFDFVYDNYYFLFISHSSTSVGYSFVSSDATASGSKTYYWFDVFSLNSSNILNISFPLAEYFKSDSIIVNDTLFWLGEPYLNQYNLYAVNIQKNEMINIFSYPVLGGSTFIMGQQGNTLMLSSPTTDDVYDFEMYPTFPVTVNVLGVPSNIYWNISIDPIASGITGYYYNNVNKTIVNSTHFVVDLYPIAYYLNISDPPQYEIYSIQVYGKGIQFNVSSSAYQFKPTASLLFNITNDPTINITFVPAENQVNFNSNLNLGNAWLSEYNLQTNVKWQVRVMHGIKPSMNIFYSNSLPPNESALSNYTLIQNSTNQNMSFYMQNGTYQYEASTIPEFVPIFTTNFTVMGNKNISLNFLPNYPHVQLASEPSQIPIDTAWVFQSTSYVLYNTTITSTVWTIKGPEYYYGTGNQFVAYFNVSGNYQLTLTVTNNYELKNSTTYNFSVLAFHKATIIFLITKRTGYWTNSSATYIVNVSYSSQLGAMSNLQGIIDGNSYMKIQFVYFANKTGNFTYEYFATFDPSNFPPTNHTVQFEAYTVNGYFNGTKFSVFFGSSSYNKPFNLIDFLGGPANFIMILLGILGTIIAIAEIKISRTSEVIIETNGKDSVLKAKPIKQKLSQRLANRKNAKMQKKKDKNSQGKGGKKK